MKYLELTKNKKTLLDDDDFAFAKSLGSWYWANKKGSKYGYAEMTKRIEGKKIHFKLHRIIMNAQKGEQIDHINGDSLDNRRENLRICTQSQNNANRRILSTNNSGYRGVSWSETAQMWRATIKKDGLQKHIGYFPDKKTAARIYNIEAMELFGEFAVLNILK